MALLGGQLHPLIDIRLYDPGEAEPRVTDRGYVWRDSLFQSNGLGESSRDSRNRALLEWLPEIGLTCKGFIGPQDTLLVDWDVVGGSWAERKPATGRYRNVGLNQYDSVSAGAWGIRKRTPLEANPSRVLMLQLPDMPPDFDAGTIEPFVSFEVGSGTQRLKIQLDKDSRCYLLRWDVTVADFVWARDLPAPVKGQGFADAEVVFIHFRVKRGRFGVSTDGGKEWNWWGDPETVAIPAAKPVLRGAGGEVTFWLFGLEEFEGVWLSPQQPTLTSTFFGSAGLAGRYDAPVGKTSSASIAFTDESDTFAALARYQATLTPNSEGQGPVLYSTILYYAVDHDAGSGAYTTPWTGVTPSPAGHGRAVSCRISKPANLWEATCTIRIKLAPTDVPITNLRRRKLVVRLGYRTFAAGVPTDHYWTAFTGYIGERDAEQAGFGDGWQTIRADAGAKWSRTEWWPTDVLALGELGGQLAGDGSAPGTVLNTALDYVLYTEGVEGLDLPQFRDWHPLGDSWVLPPGSPEQPFELLRAGEKKRKTIERVVDYAGMESGVDDNAKVFTLVKNPSGTPATTGVSHSYRARETRDLEELAKSITTRTDYDLSATAVMRTGVNQQTGLAMRFYAVDVTAETDQSSERYCPWREGGADGQQEVSDPCTPGLLLYQTGEAAYEAFPIKDEPDLSTFLNLGVSRRDTIDLYGFGPLNIPDGTAHVVMTNEIAWEQPLHGGPPTLSNDFGLWRIPA